MEKEITKVSEITYKEIANYLRISEINPQIQYELSTYLKVAKKYIIDETALKEEELDKHEDLIIAVYVLCQDMYDHRSFYVEESNVNKVIDTILGRHRKNLL